MNTKEIQLASQMLKIASRQFAQHGCNDVDDRLFGGWAATDREKFIKEYHDYNGDPEEFDKGHLHLPDFAIMNFLSHKLANRAETLVSQAASQAMPEPNQQLFTIDELMGYLLMQRIACVKQYNKYCRDRQLPISDTCRTMILKTTEPEIVKS